MPSQYVPTGKPRGRPKTATPTAPPSAAPADAVALLKDTTVDRAHRPMDAICPECFPQGWDGAVTATVGCQHGIWVKR